MRGETESLFTSRRPAWLVALAMLVTGAVPLVGLMFLTNYATWGAVLAGLLFWPCAVVGGCVALIGEGDRHDW